LRREAVVLAIGFVAPFATHPKVVGPKAERIRVHERKVAAMLNKARLFPGILACMLALAFIAQASAGEVKLVSDTMDIVCRVEVTSGPAAPNAPIETYIDVKRDWSITKPDKLCYRRSSTPDNCESGMTQWNTQWKCAARVDSGIEELSLK